MENFSVFNGRECGKMQNFLYSKKKKKPEKIIVSGLASCRYIKWNYICIWVCIHMYVCVLQCSHEIVSPYKKVFMYNVETQTTSKSRKSKIFFFFLFKQLSSKDLWPVILTNNPTIVCMYVCKTWKCINLCKGNTVVVGRFQNSYIHSTFYLKKKTKKKRKLNMYCACVCIHVYMCVGMFLCWYKIMWKKKHKNQIQHA